MAIRLFNKLLIFLDYTGRYCETLKTVCGASNPCQNGGVCNLPTPYLPNACRPGLTGPDCNVVIDTCASNPCSSPNATCVQTRLNEFKCICPPYQTGALCETTINLCDSKPCPHGIQCLHVSFLETKCVCPPGEF